MAGRGGPSPRRGEIGRRIEDPHLRSRAAHAGGQGGSHVCFRPSRGRGRERGAPVTARAGHACRSELETAVCREMGRQCVEHEQRSLRFRVQDERGGTPKYEPAIVARRGPILFLVEPLQSLQAAAVERLSRFLEQHSPEIVLVVVTQDATRDRVPPEAYDEIYAASAGGELTTRIRDQDPERSVRPRP